MGIFISSTMVLVHHQSARLTGGSRISQVVVPISAQRHENVGNANNAMHTDGNLLRSIFACDGPLQITPTDLQNHACPKTFDIS
jgi:hypothetical protein